jgi:type VII secretion integral membrane protein EccD
MTSAQPAELCRISVFGPAGRADLAVPLTVPVAHLLPVLLTHTGGDGASAAPHEWVLQRLGAAPLDPTGTPETLEWREGEVFHLRPAADPLPELAFDDVADGLATMVNKRPARWRPEFNRGLFLGLSIAVLLSLAEVLLLPGDRRFPAYAALIGAAVAVVLAVLTSARSGDRGATLLLGMAGCGFAGLGTAIATAGGPGAAALGGDTLLAAAVAVAAAGGFMLLARVAWAPDIPFAPFTAVAGTGLLAAVALWAGPAVAPDAVAASGLVAVVLVLVLVVAPRTAVRVAGLRAPQLPWNAEELQRDLDPIQADLMERQASLAEGCLTSAVVAASVVVFGALTLLANGEPFPMVLAALVCAVFLLRARTAMTAWQRVPLVTAGGLGLMRVMSALLVELPSARAAVVIGLAGVATAMMFAMVRPPTRRMLPIWGHVANGLEWVSAAALVPVVLQLFGVYAWAQGLFG